MKRVCFISAILMFTASAFSQNVSAMNEKKAYFGISIGACAASLVTKEELPSNLSVNYGGGWNMGVFTEVNMSKYFALSPRFEVSFIDGNIKNRRDDNRIVINRFLPLTMDFMVHAKLKRGKSKLNPYIAVGPKYQKVLSDGGREYEKWSDKSNLAIDFIMGMDLFFKRFVFAPELRYTYGLTDLNTLFTDVGEIKMNTLSLVFVFKG